MSEPAQFAPVAPPRILKRLYNNGGTYHLILAHDILRVPDEYRGFFTPQWSTIFLDNSITELGSAVNIDVIMEAADISGANVLVLPDVYYDSKGTIASCKAALRTWPDKALAYDLMIVPQGNTLDEWAVCAQAFADEPQIKWWGIPRNLVSRIKSRWDPINIARMLNPDRGIHLLGFSDNVIDDMICAHHPKVSGIDSAVPVRAASLGIEMSMVMNMPKRGDWFETAEYVPLMDTNVKKVRQWLKTK